MKLLIMAPLGALAAGDRLWSALALATIEPSAASVPEALEELAPAIKKIFVYNSLYLLGQKKRDLFSGSAEASSMLQPMSVPASGVATAGPVFGVPARFIVFVVDFAKTPKRNELYHGKDLLVTTEAKLAKHAPLYIRGPQWGRGLMIFVLEVR